MKHILPLLTIALFGAAATASADHFYYDYYKDPGQSGVANEYWVVDDWNKYESGTDTFTYKNFGVARNSDWEWVGKADSNTTGKAIIDNSNFYRIQVVGNDVDLYLTDFVDTALDEYNENALYHHISEYGYRKLEKVEIDGRTQYVATDAPVVNKLSVAADGTPMVTYAESADPSNLSKIDTVTNQGRTIDRYQYYLGTFNDGDVIEVYMKDLEGGEAFSYSGINEIDSTTNAPVGAGGAFGDGGYRVSLETDEMLNGYYFQDENLEPAYRGFGEGEAADAARASASAKAMPLSALDPSGSRVYFGIIAKVDGVIVGGGNGNGSGNGNGNGAAGSPLPDGLPIALVAGLFGLGFWYIRRRKASVA